MLFLIWFRRENGSRAIPVTSGYRCAIDHGKSAKHAEHRQRHEQWHHEQRRPFPPISTSTPRSRRRRSSPSRIDTAQFAKAAAFAAQGRDDLARRGYAPDGEKRLRQFSTWEVCRYLIPVAPAHFRRVLKAQPGSAPGRRRRQLQVVHAGGGAALARAFRRRGRAGREYRPYRPEGLPAKVVAVANFKGGVGKTSTCAHLAMSAALDGYRVLVIDLDSQGSMTSIMGGKVADEWRPPSRCWPRIIAHALAEENDIRREAGRPPLPLDETLTEALEVSPRRT